MFYYVCLPSLTGIAGFFCLRPRRMKKRTSGMKISKASTHCKGKRQNWQDYFALHFRWNLQAKAECSLSAEILLQGWPQSLFFTMKLFVTSHLPAHGSHCGLDWVCLLSQIESLRRVKDVQSAQGCHCQKRSIGFVLLNRMCSAHLALL